MVYNYRSFVLSIKPILLAFALLFSIKANAQSIGDYVSVTSGSWTNTATWGVVTGTGPLTWNAAVAVPGAGNNVFIQNTHIVNVPTSGNFCQNLTVQTGGKLFANSVAANVYISVTGNITCNGQIGNFPSFDALSFNIEGANCLISGTGQFDSSRMRKNSNSAATTNLTIDMNVNLWFPTNSTTQIYNNVGNTNFNVTVGVSGVVNLLSSGGFTGHASIDGLDGGAVSANGIEAGGTWTINGTMIVSGRLYLGTNNAFTAYRCNWIVNGLLTASEIVAGASGAGGSTMTVNAGGRLEISGTPAWSTLSPTNNVFTFASGSTVEYSASGNQLVRVASEFGATSAQYYGNLICSFSGTKSTNLTNLWVKNNLTISGSAVLAPLNTSIIFVGGNWFNWGSAGFTEGFTTVRFNNGTSTMQSINCPGGETFSTLVQNSANNILRFNCNVTVQNQLTLQSGNGLVELNGNTLTVMQPLISGITGGAVNRYIISERTDNSSRIAWNIGAGTTTTTPFTFPFGTLPANAANYCPVTIFKSSSANIGTVTISTYSTPANNQPWPSTPTLVTNLWADNAIHNQPDNRSYTVDRFWEISATNPITLDSLRFSYRAVELPDSDAVALNMRAQRWVSAIQYWDRVQFGLPSTQPTLNTVSVAGFNIFNTSWTLSSTTSPLPIELLSFKATKLEDAVQLDWSTATEINNDYFTLERSKNGIDFFPLKNIQGAGNSTMTLNYSWTDESPLMGVSYYRLKQTDFDGKYSYSQTVVVNMDEDRGTVVAFPNPAKDMIYLTGEKLDEAEIRITSLQGIILKHQHISENNSGVYSLQLGDIPPGIYFLEILNETERRTIRIIRE